MMRFRIVSYFVLSFGHAVGATLVANPVGEPQDFINATRVNVCAHRSQKCNVLLDVPSVCAGSTSTCPVIFCLHGHGGGNGFAKKWCSPSVHTHGFVGVYPHGDDCGGKPGWNDGMGVRCKYDDFN